MSEQINRNVIALRRADSNDGVSTYVVTFDNDVTLNETYEMASLTDKDGKQIMTGDDFIDVLKVDTDKTFKYKLIRTLGTCTASSIVDGDKPTDVEEVAIESIWEDALQQPNGSAIYSAAKKIVTNFTTLKYGSHSELMEDRAKLEELLATSNEAPSAADITAAAYAMLFDGPSDESIVYLKHAIKHGTAKEAEIAQKIIDSIKDYSLVTDIPMASYLFDSNDKDLEKDMVEAYKMVEADDSEATKNKIAFSMGKAAERKFKEGNVTPYDCYCIACILTHAESDVNVNDVTDLGIKLAEDANYPLDVMQFKLLIKR